MHAQASRQRSLHPPGMWRAIASYSVWAVCFTVLYTGHALACTAWVDAGGAGVGAAVAPATVRMALFALWLVFIVWLLILARRSRQRYRHGANAPGFMPRLIYLLDASAVVVTVVSGLPVVLSPVCL